MTDDEVYAILDNIEDELSDVATNKSNHPKEPDLAQEIKVKKHKRRSSS